MPSTWSWRLEDYYRSPQPMDDSSPARRLPVELTAHVFSYLETDKPSLAVSSLVSFAWARITRRSLFRALRFCPERTRNEDAFLRFLEEHPELCQYVRLLTIAHAPHESVNASTAVFIPKIASILRLLPALQSFTIAELGLLPSSPPLLQGLPNPVLKALHSLELFSVGLGGSIKRRSAIALEFLQLFSTISELVVDDLILDYEWEKGGILHDVSEMPPAFQVRSLSVPSCFCSAILIFEIIKRTSGRYLHKLDTRYRTPIELSAFQDLVNETSPQLSDLSLRMNDDYSEFAFDPSKSLSLHHCTALQTVKFILPTELVGSWAPSCSTCFNAMTDILHSLPSTTDVTQLFLEFSDANPGSEEVCWVLASLDWKRLEDFGLNCLRRLEELRITFVGEGAGAVADTGIWRELIRKGLAGWGNIEALRFDGDLEL